MEELIRNRPEAVEQLFVLRNRAEGDLADLVEVAHERELPVEYVERERLDQFYGGGEHRGIVAQCSDLSVHPLDDLIEQSRSGEGRLLVLDQIQDPVNLGTLARSALFLGVDGIIKMTDRSAPLSETVIETSVGAATRIPFAEVTNLRRTLDRLKDERFWIVGADAAGEQVPADVPRDRNLALVLGHEGTGLRRLTREHCDYLVRLEGSGRLDSLNVGVAGSILMYALRKPVPEDSP